MKTLIDLFPALTKHKLDVKDPRGQLLLTPSLLEGDRPVRHPTFQNVSSQLFSSIKGSPLTLLIGASGVGKTRLVVSIVERLNGLLKGPGRIPAVALVAPTSQRTMFSWKAFWERLLTVLEDPLPNRKVDPAAHAEDLRARNERSRGRIARTSESQYFEIACSAAAGRGLALLVIDEATALVRSQHGVTLLDQIAVLRELADRNLFRIVLASTFEILPHFRRAGVLDRRLSTVVFPRYSEVLTRPPNPVRVRRPLSLGPSTYPMRGIERFPGGPHVHAAPARRLPLRVGGWTVPATLPRVARLRRLALRLVPAGCRGVF